MKKENQDVIAIFEDIDAAVEVIQSGIDELYEALAARGKPVNPELIDTTKQVSDMIVMLKLKTRNHIL